MLVQYFGLGEVTGNITVLRPGHHDAEDGPQARIGTCGFERIGMQVEIQNDAGEPVATGETGEICVLGPAVFAGYHDNPEANAKAFRNGWFRTSTAHEQAAAGETIMELFSTYARGNPKSISADTLNQARRDIGTFVDHVGGTCPVHRIDKKPCANGKRS